MASYRYLVGLSSPNQISITLYSGNWDAVVPYIDTVKGIKLLNLHETYT